MHDAIGAVLRTREALLSPYAMRPREREDVGGAAGL
jgi:hypothetical protein